jgi:hypothetical protein
MELVLTLLKSLASSLSPTEFLVVLCLFIVAVFTSLKFLLKHVRRGRRDLTALLTGEPSGDDIRDIQVKLDDVMTLEEFEKAITLLTQNQIKSNEIIQQELHALQARLEAIAAVGREMQLSFRDMHEDMLDVKEQNRESQSNLTASTILLKTEIAKALEHHQRVLSQVEKIDEFCKAAVPEFRSYHKDLSKSVSDLSRDVALVERSVQTQLNTGSAVKLR